MSKASAAYLPPEEVGVVAAVNYRIKMDEDVEPSVRVSTVHHLRTG